MKTQEEIEQLAYKIYADGFLKGSFIHGYTQCQKDMAIEIAELKIICQEYSKDVKALNDIINSLKK